MAIEYKTVTYRTVESANDNATYCWVELSASHVPSVNGVIKRIVVQGATTSASGMTTDPMYLGLWERQDDGGLISLGCSKNAVTQARNQENTWDFDGAIVSGKSLLLGLLSSPDEHWTNNTDLLLRSRVQTNDTDGCVILTNIGRLRVTPDITFTVEYPEYVPDADPEPEPEPEPESEQRVIDISKYWIPIIRKTTNFQQIAAAENPEFNLLVEKLNALEKDGFIPTATEYGVKRWEQILGLVASDGMTLDERKAQILNYLNVKTAYTIRTLRQMLAAIVGEGNYTMHIDNDTQTLHMAFTSSVWDTKMNDVESLLKRVLPMNLDVKYDDIPMDFTELEYLESTGTQYINSQVYPDNETGAQVVYQITKKTDYQPCGVFYSGSPRLAMYMLRNNAAGGAVGNWGSIQIWSGDFSDRCTYAKKITSLNFLNDRKAYIKCPEYGEETIPINLTWNQAKIDLPLGLFCCLYHTGLGQLRYNGKIFEAKMSQGNTLVRYFAPVLDETGTPCMWDKISHKAFYNNGTGTFGYKIKSDSDIMTLDLDDPYYTAPSGVWAKLIAENTLDIITALDPTVDESQGYKLFANTGEAYEHFNIKEVIENE